VHKQLTCWFACAFATRPAAGQRRLGRVRRPPAICPAGGRWRHRASIL